MAESDDLLHKAINSAKNFKQFEDVILAVSLHPEWLTLIPENRKWAILHQVIFSGNVNHLDQLLALQKANKDFRLLTNTKSNETIFDIANQRKDVPAMINHIQRLIQLDEMLSFAKECDWDHCYNIVKNNPTLINEKPPYRRYYLIHHMAFANAIDQFQRFKHIKDCIFNPTLQADRKKINDIARDCGHIEFAQMIEKEFPSLLEQDDPTLEQIRQSSTETDQYTQAVTSMLQSNLVKDLDDELMNENTTFKGRHEVVRQIDELRMERTRMQRQKSTGTINAEDEKRKLLVLDNLTCPLTMNIFTDPVIASDGFTYERSAITKWMEKNDRSPMTNQPFAHKELHPNNVVKQILQALSTKS